MFLFILNICALIYTAYALPVSLQDHVNGNNITSLLSPQSTSVNTFVPNFPKKKNPFEFPPSGRKEAVLEQDYLESPHIKIDAKYANLQEFLSNIGNPKPIIDTIEEHEKYGNTGDKGRSVATAIIGGFEIFSNVLNAAVEVPVNAAKQLNKKISASLNVVGEKLVGLA